MWECSCACIQKCNFCALISFFSVDVNLAYSQDFCLWHVAAPLFADGPLLPIALLQYSHEHCTLWWLEDLKPVLKFVMHTCILCPPSKPDKTGCPFRCRPIRLLAAPDSSGLKLANFGVDECATGNYTSMCLIRTRLASGKYLFTWRCAFMAWAWPFAEACVVHGKEIGSKRVVQTRLCFVLLLVGIGAFMDLVSDPKGFTQV